MTYQECYERLQAAQRALNALYALEALIEDTDDDVMPQSDLTRAEDSLDAIKKAYAHRLIEIVKESA